MTEILWTNGMVETIRQFWSDASVPMYILAERVGVGEWSVRAKAEKLGLGPRPQITPRGADVFKWPITPWPDDVRFEDHPNPHLPGEITVRI